MEILYSETIFAFIKKCKGLARKILSEEMNLRVGRSRFFVKNTSYPLHIVTFEHPSRLGYFQADLFEIGVNKTYLHEGDKSLLDLLRHELAHYMTFITFGPQVPHHGKEFLSICKQYGWNAEVSRAVIQGDKIKKNEKILGKVQKLLSLSDSPHPEEAEAATLKAKELLLKYSLEFREECDEMHLLRFLPRKRSSAKLHAISSILRTFLVYPVFNHGRGCVYLEILGKKVHVEVAEYVANFLDNKFELLWKEAKKETPSLKGAVSKNSFFRGLAEGYTQKSEKQSSALIRMENQLTTLAANVYPHLASSRSSYKHHETANKLGKDKGKKLSINRGLKKKNDVKLLF